MPAPSKGGLRRSRRRYTQAQLEAQFAAKVRAAERREVLKATAVLTAARKQFQAGIGDRRKGVEEPSQLPDPRIITPEQRARLDVKAAVEAGAVGLFACDHGHSLAEAAATPLLLMPPSEWKLCLLCFPEAEWPPFPPPIPPLSELTEETRLAAIAEDHERALVRWHTRRAEIDLRAAAKLVLLRSELNALEDEEDEMGKRKVHMSPPAANPRDVEDQHIRDQMERCQKPQVTRLTTTPTESEK